jgi:hypothetical protein
MNINVQVVSLLLNKNVAYIVRLSPPLVAVVA